MSSTTDESADLLDGIGADLAANFDKLLSGKTENHSAATSACARLIEASENPDTPRSLLAYLSPLVPKAFERLKEIAETSPNEAARTSANVFLLKRASIAQSCTWPPDIKSPDFQERYRKAMIGSGYRARMIHEDYADRSVN